MDHIKTVPLEPGSYLVQETWKAERSRRSLSVDKITIYQVTATSYQFKIEDEDLDRRKIWKLIENFHQEYDVLERLESSNPLKRR